MTKYLSNLNKYGIPAPLIRDPATGLGSVSLTLVFLSSFLVIFEIISQFFNLAIHPIDKSLVLDFFFASCALYFGRKWRSRKKAQKQESSSVE